MSPGSQGALEVERYIGSCLFSAGRPALQKPLGPCRKQEQQQQQQQTGLRSPKQCQSQFGTWAGGVPLISMASNPRRNNQRPVQQQQQQQQQINHASIGEQQLPSHLHNRVPLSRLAVHTQGAPLILSNRFPNNNRAKIHNNASNNSATGLLGNSSSGNGGGISNPNTTRCHAPPRMNKPIFFEQKKPQQQQQQAISGKSGDVVNSKDVSSATAAAGGNVANIDSLSIASDESSGSNNSENSLPRIIKPRKRRKKDRKPPLVVNPVSTPTLTMSDVKVADEAPSLPVVTEQQAQQQQQHQIRPYASNPYSAADSYYKGHRRLMGNNSGPREGSYARLHPNNNNNSSSCNNTLGASLNANPQQQQQQQQQQEVVDTRQQQQQQQRGFPAHRHVQVKVLDDNRNVILPVPVCPAKANYLRHSNNTGNFLRDYNEPVTLSCHQEDDCIQGSICQCRYSDPATLIWDVSDQSGYSPQYLATQSDYGNLHHHRHHHRYGPATVFVAARPIICQEHPSAIEFFDVADNPCLRLRTASTERVDAAILRRSWSDPTSYFSDEIVPCTRDVGVIGDRGQSSEAKSRNPWRGDVSSLGSSSPSDQPASPTNSSGSGPASPGPQGPLEVSTEIVTSPNGHRDLEIKFYSSSPTSYATGAEQMKSAFAFNDDDEDPNDIWSYHESKLQQDFRTLLQAEE